MTRGFNTSHRQQPQPLDHPLGDPITDLPRYDATTALSQPGRTLPDAPLLGGLTLDHYCIVKLLGKGGMGEVYLAQDTRLGHEVAIKVLPAALAQDPERIQRFEREARLLARLHHPHIATIHLLGQSGAVRYLVLEYVPGATLSERLEGGKLTAREALPLLRQLASALGHAHTQPEPIIHRDLKPDNLKLTTSGEIKVLDFGLAKAVRSDFATAETADSTPLPVETFSTTHHVIQGTVPYMSPEQTLGQRLDQRTDWWAFGCIGFELLTGQRPFHSLSLDGMLKAINQDEPTWERLPRETPAALRRLLQQCLQKDPQQRLAAAAEAERWLGQAATELRKRKLGVPGFWSKAVLAGVLMIMAGVAVNLTPLREMRRQFFAPPAPAPAPPAVTKPHLAVLPFKAAAGETEAARLGAGLSQMLRDSLAGSAELVVLPFGDVVQAETQTDPAELLHNFGAQFLLEGEVTPTSAEMLEVKLHLHQAQQPPLNDFVTGKRADFTGLQTALLGKVQNLLALKTSLPTLTDWFKQSSAQGDYLTALAYLQSDLTKATVEQPIKLLENLTASDPTSARAWAVLAQAYLRKGQLTNQLSWIREAESASTKALARAPDLPEAQLTRGFVLSALGNYEEAAKAFVQVLNRRPDELEARLGLAGVFEDKPDASQAEMWYRQAVNLWPNYWACYNELGAFHAEQGHYDKAYEALARVLQLDPKNLSARINSGNALLKLGKFNEAEQAYSDLLTELAQSSAQADGEDALLGLGTALFLHNRWQEAADQFRQALTLNPNSPTAQANLGDALSRMAGNESEALDAYSQTITLYQRSQLGPKGYGRLAEVFAKRSRVQLDPLKSKDDRRRALDTIKRALQTKPEKLAVLYSAVLVHVLCGQTEQALDALELAHQLGYGLDDFRYDPWLNELQQQSRYLKLIPR